MKKSLIQTPAYPVRAFLVLFISAIFLFYKYILQNFPSVMALQLMDAFHLQGLGLGVLSSVYFWTYLIVPLFVGVMLDHCGTRWITTGAIFICALGLFVFSHAMTLNMAVWGRACMGVGVSFATITYFKLASVWFDKKYYAVLTSFVVVSAMIGAVCGQMPLAWLMQQVGWRMSLDYLGCLGLLLGFLFLFVVSDSPKISYLEKNTSMQKKEDFWAHILLILRSKQNWLLTGFGGLAFSPLVIFCGLWGNPFLQQAHHIDKLTSSTLISLAFVGLGIASPIFAISSNFVKSRRHFMMVTTFLSALCLASVIYIQALSLWMVGTLIFFFGFFLGSFSLVFVIGKESNPLFLAGTVISLINASDAFFDAITEPLIGGILDFYGHSHNGVGFSLSAYYLALGLLPLYQMIGAWMLKGVEDNTKNDV